MTLNEPKIMVDEKALRTQSKVKIANDYQGWQETKWNGEYVNYLI